MTSCFLPFAPASHPTFQQRVIFQCRNCKVVFARSPDASAYAPNCKDCNQRTVRIAANHTEAVPGLHVCFCCNVCHLHWSLDTVKPNSKLACAECGTLNRPKFLMPTAVVGPWVRGQEECRSQCSSLITDAWLDELIVKQGYDAKFKNNAGFLLWSSTNDVEINAMDSGDIRWRALAHLWSRIAGRPASEFDSARSEHARAEHEKAEDLEVVRRWEATKNARVCDFCEKMTEDTKVHSCHNARRIHTTWLHACSACVSMSRFTRVICYDCRCG